MEGERRVLLRKVYACYFLSGALGLVYQILWLRKLLLVFGSTVHAVSTVLTVFFGGLAIGSWLFGRLIDRDETAGLRWYAWLELGVGAYAFLTLPLFHAVEQLYIPVYRASGFSPTVLVAASFVCSTAILLLPTILLGGTFPVLSRFLIRAHQRRGAMIAGLYGLNTAGAMLGTAAVYSIGLPMVGLTRTLMCAGVLNISIGLFCLLFDRQFLELGLERASEAPPAGPAAPATEAPDGSARWLLLAFGLSGFSAMVYEVTWTRTLSLVLGSSIYAFCVMLATFLGGMAIGSGVARHRLKQRPSTEHVVVLELLLGAYGMCSLPLMNQLPSWLVTLWPLAKQSFSGIVWLQCALSAAVMLIPTLLMGYLFPVVSDLVTGRLARLGRQLGNVYAINTVGGILGSFLSGFVLIPLWGLPWAILTAALVNLLAAFMVFVGYAPPALLARRLGLAAAGLASAVFVSSSSLIPMWQREVLSAGVYMNPDAYRQTSIARSLAKTKLLYYRDSLNATVSVHQQEGTLFLKVGGKTDASNGIDMGTQVLSAHIPMLLHKRPERALVIGLGSGVTLGEVAQYPVSMLHCAEIDPAVIEGARYFKTYNHHVHEDPRVRIFAVDGRNFLLATTQQYDVIISEPSNPWMAGLAYLFTQEFYELAKHRLARGGIMCQWLQLYRMFPNDIKLMLHTFHQAFPYVTIWSSIPGDMLLVGSMEPQQFDARLLAERMAKPEIRAGLSAIHVEQPASLLQLFWFGSREVEELTGDITWLHQDDQPEIEFRAPKALYLGPDYAMNYRGLEQFKVSPRVVAPDYDEQRLTAEQQDAMVGMWVARGELDQAQSALERATTLQPASGALWTRLGELYLSLRREGKASEALTKAVALAPRAAAGYGLLARLSCQEGRFEQAQQLYEQAGMIETPDAALAEEIGNCLSQAKQFARAAEYYRSAVSQQREPSPGLWLVYAKTLKELHSTEALEQVATAAVRAFPAHPAFPLLLGELRADQQRWAEAAQWYQRVLSMVPEQATACYGLGRVALGVGRPQEAVRYLKQALRSSPYDRPTLKLLQTAQRGRTLQN